MVTHFMSILPRLITSAATSLSSTARKRSQLEFRIPSMRRYIAKRTRPIFLGYSRFRHRRPQVSTPCTRFPAVAIPRAKWTFIYTLKIMPTACRFRFVWPLVQRAALRLALAASSEKAPPMAPSRTAALQPTHPGITPQSLPESGRTARRA